MMNEVEDDEALLGKNISLKLKPIDLLNLALRCVVLVRLIKNMGACVI